MISFIILFPILFLCFFILYSLSKHDFLFSRKGIALVFVFNVVLISMGAGFVIGRLFYIFDIHNFILLHPLNFFHVIEYPGFSLYGGFIGSSIMLSLLTFREIIMAKMLDIASLSFYPLLLWFPFSPLSTSVLLVVRVGVFIVLMVLLIFLYLSYKNYFLKDGSTFLVICIIFSALHFLSIFYKVHKILLVSFAFSQLVSIVLIVISVILIARNEGLLPKKIFAKLFPSL